jgi:hypothetical protein
MKKIHLLTLLLPFFLQSCVKTELEEDLSDSEFLELAYDSNFFYPDDFYKDPASPEHSIYYVNTVSISPINQRDSRWIELSTDDRDKALEWVNLTILNSNEEISISLVEEKETEKYFEFKSVHTGDSYAGPYSYVVLFRVHKASYYHSIFDRFQPWNHVNETNYGSYNAEIEAGKVKECIEYLWVQNTFANLGQKVLTSTMRESNAYFEVYIVSLSMTYGDWGLRDSLSVYDNYIRFNKNNRLISFVQLQRKEIPGKQR